MKLAMEISRNKFCNPYPISNNLEGIKGLKLKEIESIPLQKYLDGSGMLCHFSTVPHIVWEMGTFPTPLSNKRDLEEIILKA